MAKEAKCLFANLSLENLVPRHQCCPFANNFDIFQVIVIFNGNICMRLKASQRIVMFRAAVKFLEGLGCQCISIHAKSVQVASWGGNVCNDVRNTIRLNVHTGDLEYIQILAVQGAQKQGNESIAIWVRAYLDDGKMRRID
jgi:hypothetical protein